jgi:hypothetical protein
MFALTATKIRPLSAAVAPAAAKNRSPSPQSNSRPRSKACHNPSRGLVWKREIVSQSAAPGRRGSWAWGAWSNPDLSSDLVAAGARGARPIRRAGS